MSNETIGYLLTCICCLVPFAAGWILANVFHPTSGLRRRIREELDLLRDWAANKE